MTAQQPTVIGIDAGHRRLEDIEHLAEELALASTLGHVMVVCTHIVALPEPHYAATFAVTGPPGDLAALAKATGGGAASANPAGVLLADDDDASRRAADVAVAHLNRQAGRALRFPGQHDLADQVSVADLVAQTAIDDIKMVGGVAPSGDVECAAGFLRPHYQSGRLVLAVTAAAARTLAPFEIADPHQCCGGQH